MNQTQAQAMYGKHLSPSEIYEKLTAAGVEWRNLSDLARMFGVTHARVHQVLGKFKAGTGASESTINRWIDKHSKNGAAFNKAACEVPSRYDPNPVLSPEKIRERLKNAGVEWDNLAHLARLVGGNTHKVLGKNGTGVGESTVDKWIRQYAKRDAAFIQAARKENVNLAKYGKHLSPEEVCKRLKAAGIKWNSRKQLAQMVGITPARIHHMFSGYGKQKYRRAGAGEKIVDRWIRQYEKQDPVFIQMIMQEEPSRGGYGKWLSLEEVCRRLKANGVKWDTPKTLAQIIDVTPTRIRQVLTNGACEKTIDRWVRHVRGE